MYVIRSGIYCVKYAKTRAYCDSYFHVYDSAPLRENTVTLCSQTEKYGSEKAHILAYFTQ